MKHYGFLTGIILIGIILRLILFFKNSVINYDGVYYANIAQNLMEGNGYVINYLEWFGVKTDIPFKMLEYTPIYPLFIGIHHLLFKDWFIAGKAASLFSGIIFLLVAYITTLKIFSKRIALWTTILSSISFPLILYSTEINNDLTYGLFILLGFMFFMLGLKENRIQYYIFASLSCVLGFYTRFQAILIPIYFIIAFIFYKNKKKSWKNIILFIALFYLLITPWLIAIQNNENDVFSEKIKTMIYYSQTEATDEMTINQIDSISAIDNYYEKTPKSIVLKNFLVHNLKNTWNILLYLSPIIGILLTIGTLYTFSEWRNNLLIYGIIFFHISLPTHYTEMIRHLLPVIPLLFAIGMIGTYDIIKRINRKSIRRIVTICIIVLSLMSFVSSSYYFIDNYEHRYDKDPNYEIISKKLIEYGITNQTISSFHSHHGFYSKNKWIMIPYESYNDTIKFLKSYNATTIILEKEFTSIHPELSILIDRPNDEKFKQTELLYQKEEPYTISVFRIIY